MTVPIPTRADWTWHRWTVVVALLFAVQVGLVWWLSAPPPTPRSVAHEPVVKVLVDRRANERLLDSLAASDPALFALGSPRGFSSAWIGFASTAPRPAEWSEPDRYLGLDTNTLGGAFRQFVQQDSAKPRVRPEKPAPAASLPQTPGATFGGESALAVTGLLARRTLGEPLKLPAWPHTELLAPTVVQVLVNADGMVLSVRLLKPSGLPVADRLALDLARNAQFQPATAGGTASGDLIFNWKTVAPTTNNAVAPKK
ncbi:MAG: energy transducer TonB [Pedosphaera sp.]|nr:energy transducer TonB [Pedosphaera sp.]MST00691.1 energy transducer TonB [Pedosphaera sp.]